MRTWRTRLLAAVALVALVGCSAAASSPTTAPNAAASASPSPTPEPCPITIPIGTFVPPMPWPPVPPTSYRSAWYGTNDLWTMLNVNGEVWSGLPFDGQSFGQKTFWWSTNYRKVEDEASPDITVTARRLDGGETVTAGHPGTNAIAADFGLSMLVGVNFPSAGCWELEAAYKGATLAYVVSISGP